MAAAISPDTTAANAHLPNCRRLARRAFADSVVPTFRLAAERARTSFAWTKIVIFEILTKGSDRAALAASYLFTAHHVRGRSFQPRIFDAHKKAVENGVSRVVPLQQRTAQFAAGSAEKAERRMFIALIAAAVDLSGNCQHVQSVGIVERHGKAQQRQLPCSQHPVMPND